MGPRIESYRFGHIVIDGEAHDKDVIILPDRVIGGWWREEGHTLHPDDLTEVLEKTPETLIVGQGAHGRMSVTQDTRQTLESAGIQLIAQPTDKAVDTYNEMQSSSNVAAALHLTC